ncbi:putative late blight resistance protein homolog R1C-3 [Coffea eugenioides]|uniref:putative late blight resistance protein homolog R1C-3 n=1 Tax=Coffea eugenioides TaxID=49369 RepID=UPI000F604793|nr:putative late blight resistance protein homolog R1C-3 [Coffea eugenioides]
MQISYSSSRSCFELALEYLRCLHGTNIPGGYLISKLAKGVRLLQSFDLYLTKCRRRNHETYLEQDEEEKDVTSSRIQVLITRKIEDLEFACSEYLNHSRSPDLTRIASELTIFLEAIELFFETDISESCINYLLDCYWLRDPELVIDFLDSVSKILVEIYIYHFKRLVEKLMFLKSFIRFAMLRGVEGQQLIGLLIHTKMVSINALRLAYIWWSDVSRYNDPEAKLQISRLISEKINPSEPQVLETYIHVLTASKLSISSNTSALEKSKQTVADFMDYLVQNTTELLQPCTSTSVPIMNQMLKIVEGLRFLTILLRHQEKFKELCHEMKNLIGIVACDAAIVIFSLFVNQIEEGLAKETDLALFHLLKVLKLMRAEFTQVYPLISVSGFGFPRICELGSMDFLLRNLQELARSDEINCSNAFPVDKIQTIQEDFEFLRSFLEKIKEQRNQNEKLQAFWSHVMEIAYKAELVIDWTLVGDRCEYCLDGVARDINVMKIEAQEIYDSISDVGKTIKGVTITKTFTRVPSQVIVAAYNEELVPLDDEVKTITDSLTREGSRQLDVVPIVGMPGLGKTTLANIVYNSPSVMLHFNIRAWCTVSQAYSMHNMLVQILGSWWVSNLQK